MTVKSMDLAWIVVSDLKKAVKFYTEVVGLKQVAYSEEHFWAELQGHDGGAKLGIAQMTPEGHEKNAVPTFSVEDIEKAIMEVKKKGAKLVGDMQEVPGHVKMQTVVDNDGNSFQLVEKLDE